MADTLSVGDRVTHVTYQQWDGIISEVDDDSCVVNWLGANCYGYVAKNKLIKLEDGLTKTTQ